MSKLRASSPGLSSHEEAPIPSPSLPQVPGVFLDRDGTLIEDAHYLSDPAGVRILPGVPEALRELRRAGYRLFLFSNQSGVGRGLFPLEAVHRCNERMIELLGLGAAPFAEICIAPEAPDQPAVYRKPSPKFINEAVVRHNLDRARSWMVGDKMSDVESGWNAGIGAALVHAREAAPAGRRVPRYASLLDFARALVQP